MFCQLKVFRTRHIWGFNVWKIGIINWTLTTKSAQQTTRWPFKQRVHLQLSGEYDKEERIFSCANRHWFSNGSAVMQIQRIHAIIFIYRHTANGVRCIRTYGRSPIGLLNVLRFIVWLIYRHLLFYIHEAFTTRQKKKMITEDYCIIIRCVHKVCMRVCIPYVYVHFCASLKNYYDILFNVLWLIFL